MSKHIQDLFAEKQKETAKAFNGEIIGMGADQFEQLKATGAFKGYSFSEFKNSVFKQLRMFNDFYRIVFLESDTAFTIHLESTITSAQQGWDDYAQHWLKISNDYFEKLKAEGKISEDYMPSTLDIRHLRFAVNSSNTPHFLYDKVLRKLVINNELNLSNYEKRIQALEKLGNASFYKWATKFKLSQFMVINTPATTK